MDTSNSERSLQNTPLEEFYERFGKLESGIGDREDAIWILAAAIHNENVRDRVNDMYLKMQGYDIEELEEEGVAFFKSMLEANDSGKDSASHVRLNTLVKCTSCGSDNIARGMNKTTVRVNNEEYRQIVFDYCEDCGEGLEVHFFD